MAYFPSSNHDDQYQSYHDNYQYYQQSYNYDQHELSRYAQDYSSHTQYYDSSYQLAPSEPLIGYYYSTYNNPQPDLLSSNDKDSNFHENSDYFYDPVTTQFVISYSTAESQVYDGDLEFDDYNPEPYHGGYDISQTYGKALPPSNDICYPISKNETLPLDYSSSFMGSVTSPYGKDVQNVVGGEKPISNVLPETHVSDSEDDENEDGDEDEEDGGSEANENTASHVIQEDMPSKSEGEDEEDGEEVQEENRGTGEEIRRQIPPGYGIEAMGICDGLFGGYFPCLLKRNNRDCNQCGGEVKLRKDDYECWGDTVDYFFGNPNPYGGSMPEKGSYGDPMYSYQRHYPQEAIQGEVQYEENSLLMDSSSSYNYGHNDDYRYY